MVWGRQLTKWTWGVWGFLILFSLAGCASYQEARISTLAATDIPRELEKASPPMYRIEPPDVLLIEVVSNIRLPNAPIKPGDRLLIRGSNLLPPDPAAGPIETEFRILNAEYVVQPNGTIDLGPEYGSIKIAGLNFTQAGEAISQHLKVKIDLKAPKIAVSLPDLAGAQAVMGEHLVYPDGTVNLGLYGDVHLAGLTLQEARMVLEQRLAQYMLSPEARVSVVGFNSKVYYVITDGGGFGEQVVRLPFTGNETVLDAIAQVRGLSDVSSKRIWLARPTLSGMECAQRLPVDYRAITQDGRTTSNYQLYPGDRIYIKADHLITVDNFISKVTAPVERVFGVILLGTGVVRNLEGDGGTGSGISNPSF